MRQIRCAKPFVPSALTGATQKRTVFPIAAGVLTIIAACISIIVGILGMFAFGISRDYFTRAYNYTYFFVGIFGILGFVSGLEGGIFSIRRKSFKLSIIGASLILLCGFGIMLVLAPLRYGSWVPSLLFGLPIVFLSVLGVIFTNISKGEFV